MTMIVRCTYLVTLLTFQILQILAQGKVDGLLAQPYPASVAETFPELDAASRSIVDARSRTFYTKDPMEKVRAHYTKLLGPFEEYWKDYIYNRDVVPFKDVVDIITKRGGTIGEGGESFFGGTFAGVTISGPPINGTANYSVVKVYESLDQAYVLRFQEADGGDPEKMQKHMEDPELVQVKKKYEHLKVAYFVDTKEKRKDNKPGSLAMDEVIYDKYFTAPAEARAKELADVQKNYSDALTKMQYDAATKLGDRMVQLSGIQPNHKQDWDTAILCLQEMEKHAYTTKIVIDMHPSKWDLTPPEN